MTTPYEDRLRAGVTEDDAASHRHLLDAVMPIVQQLDQLQRNGVRMMAFADDERALLHEARRLLERKCVPVCLVRVLPEDHRPLRRPA